jgi:hypothetical protein
VKAIAAPRKPGPSPVATERVKVAMRDYAATQSVSALRSMKPAAMIVEFNASRNTVVSARDGVLSELLSTEP